MKTCEICSAPIIKKTNRTWEDYNNKRYCSKKCCGAGNSRKIIVFCQTCRKEFARSPSHVKTRNYCSVECRQKEIELTCETCGKQFFRNPSNIKCKHQYCSAQCMGIAKRTNNGQTQGRRSPEDLAWKAAVLKKDSYKCQHCGITKNLQAHHIIEIKINPALRHEISNGLTLCKNCHYYGVHAGAPNFIHGRYAKQR